MNRQERRASGFRGHAQSAAGFVPVRKVCSQCGGAIEWIELRDMDSELLRLAQQAKDFLGEAVSSVWRCTRPACAEVGFFGGVHSE